METIWYSAPEGESARGWTDLALRIAARVGKCGRLYKCEIQDQLTSDGEDVAWKEENSVPGILIFEVSHSRPRGELRRDRTDLLLGDAPLEAARICAERGIHQRATLEIAERKIAERKAKEDKSFGATFASESRWTAKLLCQEILQKQTVSKFYVPKLREERETLWAPLAWEGPQGSTTPEVRKAGPLPSPRLRAWQASPLTGSTGIEWSTFSGDPPKNGNTPRLKAIIADSGDLLSSKQVGNRASRKVNTAPEPPLIVRKALKRQTCDRETIQAIYNHVPEAKENKVLFRWIVYALWTTWRDKTTFRRVIHHKIMNWIGCYRFDSAKAVLEYIAEHLPIEFSDTWAEGRFTRQILDDGLPPELWKEVQIDLDTPPSEYDTRVYVLSGRVVTQKDPTQIRKELRKEIDGMEAPSETAHRIWQRMNDLPASRFSRFQDRIGEALEYVGRMEIDVDLSPLQKARLRGYTGCEKDDDTGELSGNVARYKARVRFEKRKKAKDQRREYKKILHRIALQHKPFYGFSRQERTDRIFSHNDSALGLPSEVRDILCEGLYDVDLKSAHLFIAAWLWGAEAALEKLTQDGYSIWDDLMEHCRPLFKKQGLEVPKKRDRLYEEVKAGMKVMVYSTVYGMDKSAIKGEVTKSLQLILGPEVGDHLMSHPVIVDIMQERDEKLAELEPGDRLPTPSGIDAVVEVRLEEEKDDDCDKVGPRSALATQAQAFEQELMSVLFEVADERDRFQLMLWLHDGAVCKARYPNAVENAVNEALQQKRKELTEFAGKDTLIPAIFEVEEIEAPELPPKDVGDRIASAAGGALRLKEGETAVRVDEETGEELGPAGQQTLLKREHELYRVAGTYVRITDDGYSIEPDPFPEEKLWEKLDSSTSSTSSTTQRDQNEKSGRTDQSETPNPAAEEAKTAPSAESRSSEEAWSPDSDTSTERASRSSDEDRENDRRTPNRENAPPGRADQSPPQRPETSNRVPGRRR